MAKKISIEKSESQSTEKLESRSPRWSKKEIEELKKLVEEKFYQRYTWQDIAEKLFQNTGIQRDHRAVQAKAYSIRTAETGKVVGEEK